MPRLVACWLGRVDYRTAADLQDRLVEGRKHGAEPDRLLLCEHDPVVTLGRRADRAHLLRDEVELSRAGILVHSSPRGGDITFHGPGQLVGYPIVALAPGRRDVHRYLRDLESALIRTVAELGVAAERVPGRTGVWVSGNKLAAIGVRVSAGWITSHGFALNVSGDLSGFEAIVPCGLAGAGVTSLERQLGHAPDLVRVAGVAARQVAEALGFELAGGVVGVPLSW